MAKIVNLTPHTITVELPDGTRQSFESSGVARCSVKNVVVDEIGGIPVSTAEYGDVVGLPEPQADTIYIASMLVAQRANRADVVGPDSGPTAIRENGLVVAVRGFVRY